MHVLWSRYAILNMPMFRVEGVIGSDVLRAKRGRECRMIRIYSLFFVQVSFPTPDKSKGGSACHMKSPSLFSCYLNQGVEYQTWAILFLKCFG